MKVVLEVKLRKVKCSHGKHDRRDGNGFQVSVTFYWQRFEKSNINCAIYNNFQNDVCYNAPKQWNSECLTGIFKLK